MWRTDPSKLPYTYSGPSTLSDRISVLYMPGTRIENQYDVLARLTDTSLRTASGSLLNEHSYNYNNANQRTRQTLTDGHYWDYGYDNIGQLISARGYESGGSPARLQEQLGYGYDSAWNLSRRTNNALI